MIGQTYTTLLAAVFGIVARRQTYRDLLYVVVSFPLSLVYLLLFLGALILDLLLVALRAVPLILIVLLYCAGTALVCVLETTTRLVALGGAALILGSTRSFIDLAHVVRRRPRLPATALSADRRSNAVRTRLDRFWQPITAGVNWLRQPIAWWRWWIVLPALCWNLAVWERASTVGWLGIDLPLIVRPTRDERRFDSVEPFPWTFLAYLLAKLPFGLIGGALVGFVVDWAVVLKTEPAARSEITVVTFAVALVMVLVVLHSIVGLVHLWGRFSYTMIGMNDTVRRLRDAEQRAAQARASAERAEQSRRDLMLNVSHELRTPIASIRAHVESINWALDDGSARALSDAELRTYLGIVEREAERLSTLVDELLALARSETDKLQLTLAPVDAVAVIDEVYQALAPLARHERQVTLVRTVPSDAPLLLADRQRLVQVLLNLVRNAITYTPVGGIVSLMMQQVDPDHLVLAVADTGSGIASADLERIFERFYRTDSSRARISGGFGLGLAIVRELVEAMGGVITVESTPGEGSCFAVRLPIAVSAASAGKGA